MSSTDRLRQLIVEEPETTPQERIQIAFDLFEAGCSIMRQTLRRSHADASDREIEQLLEAWLQDRPPDSPGPPYPLAL